MDNLLAKGIRVNGNAHKTVYKQNVAKKHFKIVCTFAWIKYISKKRHKKNKGKYPNYKIKNE